MADAVAREYDAGDGDGTSVLDASVVSPPRRAPVHLGPALLAGRGQEWHVGAGTRTVRRRDL